jgi:NADH:ubiquinone oxidoreductase subunit 3 (subunit A)
MFAGAAHLLGASAFLVAAVFGTVVSMGLQWKIQNGAFDWSDFL